MPESVPTDEQVERLSESVDRAFAERDRLWAAAVTGTDEDYAAMEEQDRVADRLLTQYNAACAAQYAESDRRRDINVARHGRSAEQTARAAGIPVYHCDDPACGCEKPGRWWTKEAREGRRERRREAWQDIRQAWSGTEAQDAESTSRPSLADVARDWLSELTFLDVEPQDFDDHEFITDDEVLRAADKAYDGGLKALARDLWESEQKDATPETSTSAPRDTTTTSNTQGAKQMPIIDWIRDYYDMFFSRLFDWGQNSTYSSPGQAITKRRAKNITANVDAKLREQAAIKSIPVAPETAERDDTRPQPEPQDLDALTATPPPPRTSAKFRPPPPKPRLNTWSRVERDWCSCEGNAHDARCRFANTRHLDISGTFPPPPGSGGGDSTEPAPLTNQL